MNRTQLNWLRPATVVGVALTILAAGCSSEEGPVVGDNPIAAQAQNAETSAGPDKAGLPRNTLPEGQGRSGGGTGAADGAATR